jgi:hypothetical protein
MRVSSGHLDQRIKLNQGAGRPGHHLISILMDAVPEWVELAELV